MKNIFSFAFFKIPPIMVLLIGFLFASKLILAQQATVSIPVGIGRPCGAGSANDSLKYFNYNSATNVLSTRSICRPDLAPAPFTLPPGFSTSLSSITFDPFDGFLYFTQIKRVLGIFNSYTYRWLPTICPSVPANLPIYRTFINQFVAGVEFDPATGLAYQINFVDTSGVPSSPVDATNAVGQYNSNAVVNGFPAIAYYDATTQDLKYARALDANGNDWGIPIIIDAAGNTGQFTSMAIINGNPAVAYYDVTNGDLRYVRATNVNGTAWGAPVTVDAAGNVGQYGSLVVVNGNPAISYHDPGNQDLKYVRATDANGTAWGAPLTVEGLGSVGLYTSMKVINGNPAISYNIGTGQDLKYIRATNASGTTWPASGIIIASAGNTGSYASMVVVNGNPAVSYYTAGTQDLKYVRATDASGTAWGAEVTVFATGDAGSYCSMAVVNGNPAISYYDATNTDLKYVRATNVDGTAWGTPVIAEAPANNVGQYTNLLVVNGNPAISYYDVTNADLRFTRSRDINGTVWYFNSLVYNMELQEVNFALGTLGVLKPISYPGKYIYRQSGDVVMTPGGQMLAIFDNKYFSINWKDYGTAAPLVATKIPVTDTMNVGAGNNIIGLAYSGGKLVASIRGGFGVCLYNEVDILTGALSAVTNGNTPSILFSSADMTNIPSGIGAAKRLVSAVENPAGSGIYDIVYEVIIKNFGGTPITNVQAFDTLNYINGFSNVISSSISSFSAPGGITQNPLFNGRTAGNFNLLTAGGTLSNIPGQNTITLQISCRISNILAGVVYNNQVVVNGNGLLGDAILDLSTNGDKPDLNSNDKPDDIGEGQPTPLLISVVAQTPPCAILNKVLFSQDFGTGTGLTLTAPAPVLGAGVTVPISTTSYTGTITQPINTETFTITDNASNANTAEFINLVDNTPGPPNGRMFIVNADAANSRMYRGGFTYTLCPMQQYSVSFFAAFIGNPAYETKCNAFGGFRYPKLKVRIIDGVSGLIITEISTADIISTSWAQYGIKFVSPASYTSIIFDIINDAPGGCGNDIALDDIQFGSCDPLAIINVNSVAGCLGGSSVLSGGLTDPAAIPGTKDYQWQVSSFLIGPYTDITGATSATYTINPVMPADTGKYYRLVVSAQGNIGNPNCRFNSPGILLTGKIPSVAASTANKNKDNICAGLPVNLSLTGGTLGSGAIWNWYDASCTSTLLGTGTSITVNPAATTTYYVKAVGDCNTTPCTPVTIFITCDIDKDNDAIPDYVESYMSAALGDHNSNGITNAFDPLYPGFVDNNNDYLNDNFQADGDSDGDAVLNYLDASFPGRVDTNGDNIDDRFDMDLDGIINMLDLDSDNDGITDVAEENGTDADGDGRIDNFTDTDTDGLSQNVDGNNTGARISGVGLGLIDLDGDGKPNTIDLDSDGDGIPDVIEAGGPDANNNAIVDGFIDANSDGLADAYINAAALLRTGADINSDGRADSYPFKNFDNDRRPNAYDVDSDMDGIVDVIEAGFADTDFNGFVDGPVSADGWNTAMHSLLALSLLNSDGIGNPNYMDIESDGDGIPDNVEGQTTVGYRFPAYLDADNDGLDNAYDLAPWAATFGGAGVALSDRDLDIIPDYIDLDTDSDGQPDIAEGNDFNLNGMADDLVTPTGLDTDGDGLDNRFDSLNSVTNLRGTSYMMGTGGSITGDPTPGTRSPVQKFTIAQPERDWRYVTYLLPIQYLQLSGADNKNNVTLNWGVITSLALDIFEIERSTDNRLYQNIATLSADVSFDVLKNFVGYDNIAGINSNIIYYRIKVTAKNGQIKYSNVIVIRKSANKIPFTIHPNPAANITYLNFYTDKETDVTISIKDITGRVIQINKAKAYKGNNSLPLSGLLKFSDGVYNVQVLINNDLVTAKLIIKN